MNLQPPALTTTARRENLDPSQFSNLTPAGQTAATKISQGMQTPSTRQADISGADDVYQAESKDPRVAQAATEDVWSNNQPVRHALAQEWYQKSDAERRQIFDNALDQGIAAEGITDPAEAARWKNAMTAIATGEGLKRPGTAENGALNPYIISGEASNNLGTANRATSSAIRATCRRSARSRKSTRS
jgi:hypothetical protein